PQGKFMSWLVLTPGSLFLSTFHNSICEWVIGYMFAYEATVSTRSRSLAKELTTAAVASVFLGFGSLFVLLASGVFV
uniref:Dolichyl-diphosphooligosaccharide-protein glycosyltransferase subunit OST5 n=1 Tax=Aegilops tauschii subsp. strangulata TaxID=200361 RepID=A0A453NSU1_AEGTS